MASHPEMEESTEGASSNEDVVASLKRRSDFMKVLTTLLTSARKYELKTGCDLKNESEA